MLKGDPLLGLRIASDTRVDAVAPELAMFRAEADHALMFALQALDEHARAIELAVECEQLGRDNDAPELVARALRAHGVLLSVLGRHDAAIDKLQASIALFEAHGTYIARTLHAKYALLTADNGAMSDVAAYTYASDHSQLAER